MCGIFGCIGKGDLVTQTLRGLKILEYRGYDSAGIAYPTTKGLKTIKSVGDISQLTAKIKRKPRPQVCIGHTRWATNGGVCESNSHPHLSVDGNIAVVHNGIIQNYPQCQALLTQHQITLQTTVDTEVIPNILYLLRHDKHKIHDYLQGQYVFCACLAEQNNALFLAKKGSLPLYIGKDDQCLFITSDTLALPTTVKQIIALQDHDTCEINQSQMIFFNRNRPIHKTWQPFTQTFTASDKNGFRTFMQKEIHEIPNVLTRITQAYHHDPVITQQIARCHQLFKHTTCVHLCACGTSYHAALVLANLIEQHLGLRAKAHISSEFTAATLLGDQANLAIVISQSGETADTLACMNILKHHRVPIIAFCNVPSSTIAQQSQLCFPLLCGPEVAVASTKVFCASILVGCLLINKFTPTDFNALPAMATTILTQAHTLIPLPATLPSKIFFIGKGLDYFLALESALKVKEVTYTHCEGYPANELKHGPLSLVDAQTLAIVYVSDTDNAISEITARGGQVIQLPNPDPNNPLSFIAKIIPAQIFALRLAEQLGINPDRPRNLAKSVTVL